MALEFLRGALVSARSLVAEVLARTVNIGPVMTTLQTLALLLRLINLSDGYSLECAAELDDAYLSCQDAAVREVACASETAPESYYSVACRDFDDSVHRCALELSPSCSLDVPAYHSANR